MAKKRKTSRLDTLRSQYLKRYKKRLQFMEKKLDLKETVMGRSHSLLWVWEFSKKAVLICFSFYVVVQVYSMAVMLHYLDFTHLGTLISETATILRDCVFAYLIKAGLENIGKIWFSNRMNNTQGSGPDEPVG